MGVVGNRDPQHVERRQPRLGVEELEIAAQAVEVGRVGSFGVDDIGFPVQSVEGPISGWRSEASLY